MTIRSFAILLTSYLCSGAHGFTPSSRGMGLTRSFAPSSVSSSPRLGTTAMFSSRDQAEQYLSESYPKFYSLLQKNPAALQRMRDSNTGFAVFAPSDAAIDSLGPEQLQLLGAAFNDPELDQVLSRIAAYHMVSAPMTAEIMGTYKVVTTRVGELPVEVAPDGTLYVNGVQIIQSYQFEDNIIQNYQDKDGNLLGSEGVEGGKICIIHEVGGFICPDDLWQAVYSHFETSGSGAM